MTDDAQRSSGWPSRVRRWLSDALFLARRPRALRELLDGARRTQELAPTLLTEWSQRGAEPEGSADAMYLAFENEFYDSEYVAAKQEAYIPVLRQILDLKALPRPRALDVGCGRGEFLSLLTDAGFDCVGIEPNAVEQQHLAQAGFDVRLAQANEFLESVPDGAFSLIVALQVVEHLDPDYLTRFISLVGKKLLAGGVALLETQNPKCIMVPGNFWADVTHRRLYPVETVSFMAAQLGGFTSFRTLYSSPCPAPYRLGDCLEANYLDYGLIAVKPQQILVSAAEESET